MRQTASRFGGPCSDGTVSYRAAEVVFEPGGVFVDDAGKDAEAVFPAAGGAELALPARLAEDQVTIAGLFEAGLAAGQVGVAGDDDAGVVAGIDVQAVADRRRVVGGFFRAVIQQDTVGGGAPVEGEVAHAVGVFVVIAEDEFFAVALGEQAAGFNHARGIAAEADDVFGLGERGLAIEGVVEPLGGGGEDHQEQTAADEGESVLDPTEPAALRSDGGRRLRGGIMGIFNRH